MDEVERCTRIRPRVAVLQPAVLHRCRDCHVLPLKFLHRGLRGDGQRQASVLSGTCLNHLPVDLRSPQDLAPLERLSLTPGCPGVFGPVPQPVSMDVSRNGLMRVSCQSGRQQVAQRRPLLGANVCFGLKATLACRAGVSQFPTSGTRRRKEAHGSEAKCSHRRGRKFNPCHAHHFFFVMSVV